MASVVVNEYILQEIDRIYSGKDLDKPVKVRGNIRQRKLLYHLNDARLHLLQERAKVTKQLEYASVTVAGILHDLKTPMALIAGYAECAQDGVGDKDYLQLIRDTVDKLQSIVDSVSVPKPFAARRRGRKGVCQRQTLFLCGVQPLPRHGGRKGRKLRDRQTAGDNAVVLPQFRHGGYVRE